MRPCVVRQAVAQTLRQLVEDRGPVNRRDVAHAALASEVATRNALRHLVDLGQARRVGAEKLAGSRVWMTLYEPACDVDLPPVPQPWGGIEALADVVASMARAVTADTA